MTEKDIQVLKEIQKYYHQNKIIPSMRYLQKIFSYKSTNSIFKHINKLKKYGYLVKNKENRFIITDSLLYYNLNLRRIVIINRKDTYVNIFLKSKVNYIAYQVNNNYLINEGIIKDDILVIQINKELKNNDIGLFIIDNKYRIMKYQYLDGFYKLA